MKADWRCRMFVSRKTRGMLRAMAVAGVVLVGVRPAGAAVALLLEQPYGKLGVIDPAGHSAIYLDHVCAQTPLVLRPCRAGEMGVVISRYDGISDHDWVAMPLLPYLYAVTTVEEIPETMDRAGELEVRDVYRRRYLEGVAPDLADGGVPPGNWYELVGSAFDRTIYGFQMETTAEQDAQFIAVMNDRKNVQVYNGMWRNCADFARTTINWYYPHAVRRNYIADVGMTSPKSVARSVGHYARKHPEAGFAVVVVPQVKGSLPRSHANVDFAEGLVKRIGVPLTVVSPVATAVMLAAYVAHGRFSMPKDAPQLNLTEVAEDPVIVRPFPQQAPVVPEPMVLHVRAVSAAAVAMVQPAAAAVGIVSPVR